MVNNSDVQADSFELKREDYIACSIFLLATQGLFLGRIKIYAKKKPNTHSAFHTELIIFY